MQGGGTVSASPSRSRNTRQELRLLPAGKSAFFISARLLRVGTEEAFLGIRSHLPLWGNAPNVAAEETKTDVHQFAAETESRLVSVFASSSSSDEALGLEPPSSMAASPALISHLWVRSPLRPGITSHLDPSSFGNATLFDEFGARTCGKPGGVGGEMQMWRQSAAPERSECILISLVTCLPAPP